VRLLRVELLEERLGVGDLVGLPELGRSAGALDQSLRRGVLVDGDGLAIHLLIEHAPCEPQRTTRSIRCLAVEEPIDELQEVIIANALLLDEVLEGVLQERGHGLVPKELTIFLADAFVAAVFPHSPVVEDLFQSITEPPLDRTDAVQAQDRHRRVSLGLVLHSGVLKSDQTVSHTDLPDQLIHLVIMTQVLSGGAVNTRHSLDVQDSQSVLAGLTQIL